jgi:hypothetical protein
MQNLILATVICAVGFMAGGASFLVAANSAWYVIPFFGITGFIAFSWHKSRTRARSRKAALDAYAEREIARVAVHSDRLQSKRPVPSSSRGDWK